MNRIKGFLAVASLICGLSYIGNTMAENTFTINAQGHSRTVIYKRSIIAFAAVHTVASGGGAVKLNNIFTARRLMKSVNILGYNRLYDAIFFKTGEGEMCFIGLCFGKNHIFSVKQIIFQIIHLNRKV